MNGINSQPSTNKTNKTNSLIKSVETAGSLAMNNVNPFAGIFSTPLYDMFSTNNPFAVDYTQYSEGSYVAYSGGFLGEFSSAVSSLSDCGGYSDSGFSGFSDGGCASTSCSSGDCGGCFTSFC